MTGYIGPAFRDRLVSSPRAMSKWLTTTSALAVVPMSIGMLWATPALANCTTLATVTTCAPLPPNPHTIRIGAGRADNNRTVLVNTGATVSVNDGNAISLGNNAIINIASGATVTNFADTTATGTHGTGNNTVEFGSNGLLTVEAGGRIIKTGSQFRAEAVNVLGGGNTILNRGLIQTSSSSAAIWFEDETTGARNVIDNFGTIERLGGGSVIGSSGANGITFYNRTGGIVRGDISFSAGDDNFFFYAGSLVTGNINGGAGVNNLTLEGALGSDDTLAGNLINFRTLTKEGFGRWTVSGSLNGYLFATVNGGTLALTGNNTNYIGQVIINPLGTVEARVQSLPTRAVLENNTLNILNNGVLRLVQPDDGSYIGQIVGTGSLEKTGLGTVTLSPYSGNGNTYSGGTFLNQGTLAVSANNALGASTGGLTFNGGTLRFNSSFNLAASRAINLGLGGGTFDTNGNSSTISQIVGGLGALTKTGAGTLTLSNLNLYTGGTNITGGTLQVATDVNLGLLTGSITLDGGTLATTGGFGTLRPVTLARAGTIQTGAGTTLNLVDVVTGSGQLTKAGTGTLLLSGLGTNTGGIAINEGSLLVNGNYLAATGATSVAGGARLGGQGVIGGNVAVASGGTLSPGFGGAGTLGIAGSLLLSDGALLDYEFGAPYFAGGLFNDLVIVAGTSFSTGRST